MVEIREQLEKKKKGEEKGGGEGTVEKRPKRSRHFVDPTFRLMCFPLEGELDFYLKNWFYLLFDNDLESPLIFVLFLKGKQNKKEKP